MIPSPHATQRSTARMKALVIYEDVVVGESGCEVAREFASANDVDELELNAWNAALLDESYFSNFIAGRAAAADMIVIALRAEGLTQSLKRWVHRWIIQEPQKHRALAVWLDTPDGCAAARVTEFIKRIARDSAVDFFHQHGEAHLADPVSRKHEVLWVI